MLNATQRKYSDVELLHEYEQLSQTLNELNDEGKGLGGRIRENISKILGVSNGQVGKLDNIRNNAVPEVGEAIKKGEMSISTANEIAKLAPEKQKAVIEKKPDISSADVKKLQDKKPKAAPAKPAAPKIPEKITDDLEDDEDEFNDDLTDEIDEKTDDIFVPSQNTVPVITTEKKCTLTSEECAVIMRYFDHISVFADEDDEDILEQIREKLESCGDGR